MERVWNSAEAMSVYYETAHTQGDCGANGKSAESYVNQYLRGKLSVVKSPEKADVPFRHFTMEVKTGAGWILNPIYPSKEDAMSAWIEKGDRLFKSQFIVYVEKFDRADPEKSLRKMRVISSRMFCKWMTENKGFYIKRKSKASAGHMQITQDMRGYGVAIQGNKNCKFWAFLPSFLRDNGMTLDEFAEKYLNK